MDCLDAELFLNSPHRHVAIVMAVADGLFALCGSGHASDELFMSSPSPSPPAPQGPQLPLPLLDVSFLMFLNQPVGPCGANVIVCRAQPLSAEVSNNGNSSN